MSIEQININHQSINVIDNNNKLEMQMGKLSKRKCIYNSISNVFVNHSGNKVSSCQLLIGFLRLAQYCDAVCQLVLKS